jgi:hypothetical protein
MRKWAKVVEKGSQGSTVVQTTGDVKRLTLKRYFGSIDKACGSCTEVLSSIMGFVLESLCWHKFVKYLDVA